jgi:hypothetical protein
MKDMLIRFHFSHNSPSRSLAGKSCAGILVKMGARRVFRLEAPSIVILEEMEAGRPPRARSPVPPGAGRVTHAKALLNKVFGLSGKLLRDHNAGVREGIGVCHKCGGARMCACALCAHAASPVSSTQDYPRRALVKGRQGPGRAHAAAGTNVRHDQAEHYFAAHRGRPTSPCAPVRCAARPRVTPHSLLTHRAGLTLQESSESGIIISKAAAAALSALLNARGAARAYYKVWS